MLQANLHLSHLFESVSDGVKCCQVNWLPTAFQMIESRHMYYVRTEQEQFIGKLASTIRH
ncbi:conserved protein of unknown function [Pseudomonas marincola]|uniref:Uncharacterized protein n=1 Tax=Pseudomonas marincola TaxID=437900 RepID=A0A653DYM4_9PSED|nr:conserved protein of unknown function [Pseudomonas marincola]